MKHCIYLLIALTFFGCASNRSIQENWSARYPNEKFIQLGPIQTRYKVVGHGPPLLLIHGLAWGYDMFHSNIDELAKHYTVYMFDQRGMGLSSKPDGYNYSVHTQFQHLMEFIRSQNLDHYSVWGHSMGGYMALMLAYYYPDKIDRMVVSDVPIHQTDFPSPIIKMYAIPVMGKFYEWFPMKAGVQAILWDVYENDSYVTPERVNWAYNMIALPGAGKAQRSYLRSVDFKEAALVEKNYFPKIQTRTLVLWGAKDKWFSPMLGKYLHGLLPNSEFVEIPGGGHMVIEEKANEVNPIVVRFLETGSARPTSAPPARP